MNPLEFEDIRPFNDEELQEKINNLIQEPGFKNAVSYVLPDTPYEQIVQQLKTMNSKLEFQKTVMYPILEMLIEKTASGFDFSGISNLSHDKNYTFLSNHRDIVLDASFLNLIFLRNGFNTCEIAIGSNLLVYEWIEDLVRINGSFIVKRGIGIRQALEAAKQLSAYIHYTIQEKNTSVWIAQREGRAKDSDDRTQESLVKMLGMAGGNDLIENIKALNIIPTTISYEYDPCDYLKAKEFLLKRDNPAYKKAQTDDLISMETGLFGFMGHIHFNLAPCINDELDKLGPFNDKSEALAAILSTIDKSIHSNYRIYPGNYVAYDRLNRSRRFADRYTPEEEQQFNNYLQSQLAKLTDIPAGEEEYLTQMMLTMYANPLRNKLIATGESL